MDIIGRHLGIDYGTKRIGLAISDPEGLIASPADTLAAVGTAAGDARAVCRWAADQEVAAFVVGLPLNMDGTDSQQTKLTRTFIAALQAASGQPVQGWDERLSSYQADELMAEMGLSRRKNRPARDALAALVILRSYLDAMRES